MPDNPGLVAPYPASSNAGSLARLTAYESSGAYFREHIQRPDSALRLTSIDSPECPRGDITALVTSVSWQAEPRYFGPYSRVDIHAVQRLARLRSEPA